MTLHIHHWRCEVKTASLARPAFSRLKLSSQWNPSTPQGSILIQSLRESVYIWNTQCVCFSFPFWIHHLKVQNLVAAITPDSYVPELYTFEKDIISLSQREEKNTSRVNVKCELWSRIIRWHFIDMTEEFTNCWKICFLRTRKTNWCPGSILDNKLFPGDMFSSAQNLKLNTNF